MPETVALETGASLPQLVDRVAKGETITLTERGIAVAVIAPPRASAWPNARNAVEELLKFREEHRLKGETVQDLIEESRPL